MEKLGPGDPQRIGAYRLLARLGAGGMGNVYLARSDRGRTVAVKLVRQELAEQEEFRARFRQEVQAARRVGGYWTAPVLDADTEAAVPWVATGYVAGPSLQQVVGHDHGALPERSVRILAAGLAHALKDIHAAGIVHRDLKPSNVLVTIDGPRVIDFGIARALETTTVGGEGLTRTGSLVGSPGFMAPEQVRGERITPACDVFCLGSVLAYAATGTLPFGAANSSVHALMFRIAQEEPDLDGVPEGIADLVRDCLRKDPGARPTLDAILERTGAEDTVAGGRSRDPWLPGSLVAQLGRHAVRLLEAEDPEGDGTGPGEEAGAGAVAGAPPGAAGSALPPVPAVPPVRPGPGEGQAPPASAGAGSGAPGAAPSGAAGAGGASGASPAAAGGGEHAAVSDGGAVPPAPPAGAVNHLPTVVARQTPPPVAPPAAPGFGAAPGAYGYPQQHPQPATPYGYPQQQPGPGAWGGAQPQYNPYAGGLGATPPYGPPPVGPTQEPERPGRRSTALLVVIALVVALGAGGTVYALMRSGNGTDDKGGDTVSPAPTGSSAPATTGGSSGTPGPTGPTPSDSASADGTIPAGYLGSWETTIDNANGTNTRELTIRQGEVGDTVLTLVADGPSEGGGTYHCVFEASLSEAPGSGGPLEIGPSTVTTGEPASSCSPGEATEVTLLPDGKLKRTKRSGGESLTYTRQ
ncbi:Serine/threonine protein kinase [Streptomyces sp. 1222.5]|uniref:serine/threonine-protein kinase n=1 Tax=unclassified Streptomyces TaxID=2593676 RepID=UPI00089AD733|nr:MULTISPECIES: serine/threonine-protein kinase [unclassified Streptomyces]PKW09014.1 serine/threonine protein kinase [Streptomyces sp. 5112.2]SEC46973.1 Serine/threonine protein kinase [Streptomyces sp. 1222.5]